MHTTLPRILLVEDDPVSRAFLAAAAEALPAAVDAAASLAEARRLAARTRHDLLLIDAHLPDGSGTQLLHELRADRPVAIAHTAGTSRDELDPLIAAGFAEVLVKPLSAAQLQHALRRALGLAAASPPVATKPCGKLPVWDEAGALAAVNGHAGQARQLRALFLSELPAQRDAAVAAFAAADAIALHEGLHRLQGSCGFVGALRLDAAVRALRGAPASPEALRAFIDAVADTLSATG